MDSAEVLLLQLEIPMEAVLEGARKSKAAGVKVILDPAPAQTLPPELYTLCDIITPNEVEAGYLVGFLVQNRIDAENAAKVLLERGVEQVIIKMGAKGAYWSNGVTGEFFEAYQVHSIDTVAAGDGALSTTKQGAQPSMPDRDAVEELIAGS